MATELEITEHLQKVVDHCKAILSWAASDRMGAKMIKEDVAHLHNKKQILLKEHEEMEKRKETMFDEANQAIARAKTEADQIVAIARENLAYAAKDREAAKTELEKAARNAYLSEKKLKDLIEA